MSTAPAPVMRELEDLQPLARLQVEIEELCQCPTLAPSTRHRLRYLVQRSRPPEPADAPARTLLQREADRIDCDLYRVMAQIERLGRRIPVAAAALNGVVLALENARPALRRFMHSHDMKETE